MPVTGRHSRQVPLHEPQAEWDAELVGGDPLEFPGYAPPHEESVVTGRTAHYAFIDGNFHVLGGSMGAAHGERVARAYRRAIDERLPVVVRTSTGGARMQEGMVSLVQMARTAAAARDHAEAGLLSVAVFGNPTTGGVYASYGSLADVRAAEAGATVGFAGPRVVAHRSTAESAYANGLVDALVEAVDASAWVEGALGLRSVPLPRRRQPGEFEGSDGTAWGEVQLARSVTRPTGIDWAADLCSSWTELRGADPVVRAGLATMAGQRLVVIAHDRLEGDGRPGPAGYRLARRALALAGRLRLPVLTLVDTPGADPGADSEAAGIAGEIARTFAAMDALPTASVSVCVGEGGSGGALAMAHVDRLLIQRHAVFSVIAPEGAAAILHRDASRAAEVAEQLKLTAPALLDLGVVDAVVDEVLDADTLLRAFEATTPGDRRRRVDAVTQRWISGGAT
jgi:acetyl-CoA carboxylase carboxyl transferase subunit beta